MEEIEIKWTDTLTNFSVNDEVITFIRFKNF